MAVLIAIEGIDGSGKGTQAQRLRELLLGEGRKVGLLSFPRYDQTQFGRAIGQFLNGEFGSLSEVAPQLAALLFAGDRFESKPLIAQALTENDVVICDRYVASNVAHQAAKLPHSQRAEFMDWIAAIEFDVYALQQPDLTLLLDLPASSARQLIARKSARSYTDKAADLQEADTDYLERVRQVYLELAKDHPRWHPIDVEREGRIRTLEEIATDIAGIVHQTLRSP